MPNNSTSASPIISALHRYREKYFADVRRAMEDEANIRTREVLGAEGNANSDAQGKAVAEINKD
jgi:hypothetical protein